MSDMPLPRLGMWEPAQSRIGVSCRIAYVGTFLLAALLWGYFGDGFFVDIKTHATVLTMFGGQFLAALVATVVSVATWYSDTRDLPMFELARWWALPLLGPAAVLETVGLVFANPIQAAL